jgi:hypothetical protein
MSLPQCTECMEKDREIEQLRAAIRKWAEAEAEFTMICEVIDFTDDDGFPTDVCWNAQYEILGVRRDAARAEAERLAGDPPTEANPVMSKSVMKRLEAQRPNSGKLVYPPKEKRR